MIHSYRIYRNMTPPDRDEKPICIELLKYPSLWVWFVAELEEAVSECCSLLHDVLLPKWIADMKIEDGEGGIITVGEYYGDDLGGLWHCYIESPLSGYVFDKTRESLQHVHVPLDAMPKDPEIDWIREEIRRESQGIEKDYAWQDNPGTSTLFRVLEFVTRPFRKPNGNGNQDQS